MRTITMREAVREALREEMQRDERVILMGEDIAYLGGAFKVTQGLLEEFGEERVRDTPISEAGFVGVGIGAAMTGLRPIVEIMFGDFITVAMDQLVNQMAKMRYMSGGKLSVPLVIRTTLGAGRSSAAQHSQSLHAWLAHVPGIKVVLPSTPHDAKGILKSAVRGDDPVVIFEDKMMYNVNGPVLDGEYTVPLGKSFVKREGTDVTFVATSSMVPVSLSAAEKLGKEGISAEVVDPCTLAPLDVEPIVQSVIKTSRAVVIDEGYPYFGVNAELAATIMEGAFDYLDGPIVRIGAANTPIPFSPALEKTSIPDEEAVMGAARALVHRYDV
jgi:pyruvate dehydrogenase E1 component beta subunit